LSTWTFDSSLTLVGCGVDAEQIHRFDKFSEGKKPWPFVYSVREIAHHRSLPLPSRGYCASFCCKEAVLKALQQSFHFPDCELFYDPGKAVQSLRFPESFLRQHGLTGGEARIDSPAAEEMRAVVYLFGARGRA
jgi:phosphopantetheinyl transferase (holo-ACP synthase)